MQVIDDANGTFEVHEGTVICTVSCRCRLGNQPLLILGVQMEAVCLYCGRGFVVGQVLYKRTPQNPFPMTTVYSRENAVPPEQRIKVPGTHAGGPRLVQ